MHTCHANTNLQAVEKRTKMTAATRWAELDMVLQVNTTCIMTRTRSACKFTDIVLFTTVVQVGRARVYTNKPAQ